jgi:tRNA (guanine6-N2)-methyltransferase
MKYVAFCTKGLEQIVQEELVENFSAIIHRVNDKYIIFDSGVDLTKFQDLRTADDIGIVLYEGKVRTMNDLRQILDQIDWQNAREYLNHLRQLSSIYSLTINSISKTFSSKIIEEMLLDVLPNKLGPNFERLDHTNFDVMVFVDKSSNILISNRLYQKSLHNRSYKVFSLPGSLKPSIAAAMVRLATKGRANLKIVDTFCGSGTILAECKLAGHQIWGSDINPESIAVILGNLHSIGFKEDDRIKPMDARATQWPDHFFDCAISNMPWDKQIEVKSITDLYEGAIREYTRILRPDGILCVLLTKPELFIKYTKKYFPQKSIQTHKLGLLGQTPTLVLLY